ncbi:MAG: hypothetical protein QHC67_13000 [Sphingobium sp.]|uniref:hypothetical protein n=1 Tax=Sphingobium sp. TaxID=1912891 RepID=UPI0029A5A03F|nr:hypothetical protein [Sphingobium sp.]MDX3910717.1 hypothetical protein [Sphingobium sp.]
MKNKANLSDLVKILCGAILATASVPTKAQAPADTPLEAPPTAEKVIAYLLKGGTPNPDRQFRFRGLPIEDRQGLRFSTYENVNCTEPSRYRARTYWRCFYTMTAFTRSGKKLTSTAWEILAHDGEGGVQPIMLETRSMNK